MSLFEDKFETKWSAADTVLGQGQLAAFKDADPSMCRWVQARTAIDLGRAQLVLMTSADKLIMDAHALGMLKSGEMSQADFAAVLATPLDPGMPIGDKLGAAKTVQDVYGPLVGPVADYYLMVQGVIRQMFQSHRQTESNGKTSLPPGGTPPGFGLPLPGSPPTTWWPGDFPWPGLPGTLPTLPGELPQTPPIEPPPFTTPPSWWPFDAEIAQAGAAVPILIGVLGIAGIAGATYYGIEAKRAGVKVEAERAFSEWQAWQRVEIAKMKIAVGQAVQLDPFVSSAAQVERVQSSKLLLVGIGVGAGVLAAVVGPKLATKAKSEYRRRRPARQNPSRSSSRPSSRRKECKIDGTAVTVEVRKLKSGYKAAYIGPTRKVPIAIPECRSYDQAFKEACNALRAAKRRARGKRCNPKTVVKRTKRTRSKTTVRSNPKRKKKTARKGPTARDRFISSQMRKGRSKKQAQADYKGRQRLRKLRRGK